MKTPELIETLVKSATPVRRLRPPLVRTLSWLAMAATVVALIAAAHGVRSDLAVKLQQSTFVASMIFTLVTAVLAAIAAFRLSLVDSPRGWILLPLPALALWISTIGYGCLTDWVSIGVDGVRMGEAVRCFATLLLTSVPIALAMLIMLRHAATLRPVEACAAGGLAVAAATSFALSLIHDLDATVMILLWNLGTALVIAGVAPILGRPAFVWIASRLQPDLPQSLQD